MNRLLISALFLSLSTGIKAQLIEVSVNEQAAYFLEGRDSILVFQIADKSLNGEYARSNYIHPLYSLNGHLLTEDFPPDHLHQRGIFWAWHQLYIGENRIGDGWEIKDIHWELSKVNTIKLPDNASAIQTEVLWKSPRWLDEDGNEKAIVKENSLISVYPATRHYRQIDIEIQLFALEEDMRIGGAENEKGYGGFSARIKLPDNIEFTSAEGIVSPQNLPLHAGAWMDFSGTFNADEKISGISILTHPDNPGYPNPWILRRKKSMQNVVYPYPGAEAVPLSKTEPTLLRYRLLIHKGSADELNIASIFEEYSKR